MEALQKLIDGIDTRLKAVEALFKEIRLPTSWSFRLPVILNTAKWFALSQFAGYASGTAYSLTATYAKLNFGTNDPTLVITQPGKYMLFARVRVDYNGATFASNRTVSLKVRRTNNTAADIANSAAGFQTAIITTQTYTAGVVSLPMAIYDTNNPDDALELWGKIDTLPTAGSIQAVEAELLAVRIV